VVRTFPLGNYGSGADLLSLSADGQTILFQRENWINMLGVMATMTGSELSFGTAGDVGASPAMALSPDGSMAAAVICCGVTQNNIAIYRVSDGSLIRTLTGHTAGVQALAFSSDSSLLASASSDGVVNVWRMSDFSVQRNLTVQVNGSAVTTVRVLGISPDNQTLATGDTGAVRLWDIGTGNPLSTISDGISCGDNCGELLDFTPDGKWLVVGGSDSSVRLWSVPGGTAFPYAPGDTAAITSVAYSPDGSLVATGSTDQTVKVRSAVDGRVLATLTGHSGAVTSVAFAPGGNLLASASTDQTVKLWSTTNYSLVQTLTGHTQAVRAVAFSPDGSVVASGSDPPEQAVKLWKVTTGTVLQTLTGAGGGITSLVYAPDGQTVVAGTAAGIARQWNVATGTVGTSYACATGVRLHG
jgi:WD40 repeat protein